MALEFSCPSCGAPLASPGAAVQIVCPYCGRHVIVPPELRPAPPAPVPTVQVVMTPAAPAAPPPGPAPAGCCAVRLLMLLLIILVGVGAATHWDSVQQAAKGILPTNFADLALTFGTKGAAPGQLHDPAGLAVDGAGNVYVLDRNPGAVSRFDAQGHFVLSWDIGPKYPDGIAADRDGNVYVVEDGIIAKYAGATGARLTSLLPGGAFGFDRFRNMAGLPDGSLLASLSPSFTDLVHIDAQGQVAAHWKDVLTGHTDDTDVDLDLAGDPAGNVYVLGTGSVAVFKFGPDGKFVTQIGSKGEGRTQLAWPVYALAVDSHSRVYVSNSFNGMQVYDGAGAYLGRLTLPERAAVTALAVDSHDNLYALAGYLAKVYKFILPPLAPAPGPTP
jgi:DNA-directed RNA polymerase subunit RPC12/RpoP